MAASVQASSGRLHLFVLAVASLAVSDLACSGQPGSFSPGSQWSASPIRSGSGQLGSFGFGLQGSAGQLQPRLPVVGFSFSYWQCPDWRFQIGLAVVSLAASVQAPSGRIHLFVLAVASLAVSDLAGSGQPSSFTSFRLPLWLAGVSFEWAVQFQF